MFLQDVWVAFEPTKSTKSHQINPHLIQIFFPLEKIKILATLEHFFYFQEKFDLTRNGTHVNNLVNSKLHVDFTIVKTSCFLLHFIVTRYDFFLIIKLLFLMISSFMEKLKSNWFKFIKKWQYWKEDQSKKGIQNNWQSCN